MLRVVNQVLDFSKIEAGKMQIETIAFSPESVIVKVYEHFSAAAAGRAGARAKANAPARKGRSGRREVCMGASG
jgi:signal transduction histidine kinase